MESAAFFMEAVSGGIGRPRAVWLESRKKRNPCCSREDRAVGAASKIGRGWLVEGTIVPAGSSSRAGGAAGPCAARCFDLSRPPWIDRSPRKPREQPYTSHEVCEPSEVLESMLRELNARPRIAQHFVVLFGLGRKTETGEADFTHSLETFFVGFCRSVGASGERLFSATFSRHSPLLPAMAFFRDISPLP